MRKGAGLKQKKRVYAKRTPSGGCPPPSPGDERSVLQVGHRVDTLSRRTACPRSRNLGVVRHGRGVDVRHPSDPRLAAVDLLIGVAADGEGEGASRVAAGGAVTCTHTRLHGGQEVDDFHPKLAALLSQADLPVRGDRRASRLTLDQTVHDVDRRPLRRLDLRGNVQVRACTGAVLFQTDDHTIHRQPRLDGLGRVGGDRAVSDLLADGLHHKGAPPGVGIEDGRKILRSPTARDLADGTPREVHPQVAVVAGLALAAVVQAEVDPLPEGDALTGQGRLPRGGQTAGDPAHGDEPVLGEQHDGIAGETPRIVMRAAIFGGIPHGLRGDGREILNGDRDTGHDSLQAGEAPRNAQRHNAVVIRL